MIMMGDMKTIDTRQKTTCPVHGTPVSTYEDGSAYCPRRHLNFDGHAIRPEDVVPAMSEKDLVSHYRNVARQAARKGRGR